MLAQIFAVVAPILIGSLIGYYWARTSRPYDADFVGRVVMNVGTPCLIISSLSKVQLSHEQLLQMVGVVLAVLALTCAAGLLFTRMLGGYWRTYLPAIVFPNTGNMGIPLCLFAFGEEGLAFGVAVFCLVSFFQFSLGIAMASGQSVYGQFLRSPIFISTLIAGVLVWCRWPLPVWASNTLGLMGGMAIPLMLLALGHSLYGLRVQAFGRGLAFAVARLGLGFAAGLGVAEAFGLEGAARGVVILQSTMPVAVFNYLIAARYGGEASEVAGTVVLSTLLSFLTLPALLWYLLGQG